MKLYAWQPKGHGSLSFFVCAENEKDAKDAVYDYVREHMPKSDDDFVPDYLSKGVGTDGYLLTVLGPMQVATNHND